MAIRSVSSYCIGQAGLGLGKLLYACKPVDGWARERVVSGVHRTVRAMARSCVWLVVPIILTGCGGLPEYAPISAEIKTPAQNSINTAYVGDEILSQGTITEHDAILVSDAINIESLILNSYKIHPGYYLKERGSGNESVYSPAKGEQGGKIDTLGVLSWEYDTNFVSIKEEDEICVNPGGKRVGWTPSCVRSNDFTLTKYTYLMPEDFQQTLIYSGKIEGKINVGYREYSGSTARPAFYNDVEYDLNDSNTIGYKGSKIEVIEATNEFLKYRIIQYFNE